ALAYPDRLPDAVPPTAIEELSGLEFHDLDERRFPSVRLARQAALTGGGHPAVLNAANEEAVNAFLAGEIPFSAIIPTVQRAVEAFPSLGYVRMGGMEAGDFGDPNGFHTRRAWQRLLILAGGPAANFLVAMLLITAYDLTQLNDVPGRVIGVVPNSPAAAAGIRNGDQLRTVEGRPITSPDQLRSLE